MNEHKLKARINTPGRKDRGFEFSLDDLARPPQHGKKPDDIYGFFYSIEKDRKGIATFELDLKANHLEQDGVTETPRTMKLSLQANTLCLLLANGMESGELKLTNEAASRLLSAISRTLRNES